MAKVTTKERKQAQNERLYSERVGISRRNLFLKPYTELGKAIEKELLKVDDEKTLLKSIDKNIDKVFKPLMQKSLFDSWRLNIEQFVDYFVNVWGRNINVDKIASVKSKLLDRFLEKYSSKKITSITEKTRSIIKNRVNTYAIRGMSYRDMVKKIVADTKGEIGKTRASLIAREETSQCLAETNGITAKKSGLKFKKWIHRGGGKTNRPNHEAMDGVKIKIGELFDVPSHGKAPSVKMRWPKDVRSTVAGQIINCYCSVIFTRK